MIDSIRARVADDNERRVKVLKQDILVLLMAAGWVMNEADHPATCILGRQGAMYQRAPKCECGLDDLRAVLNGDLAPVRASPYAQVSRRREGE